MTKLTARKAAASLATAAMCALSAARIDEEACSAVRTGTA